MANLSDLKFRLSGGASNVDPTASHGDAMSTVAGGVILSQSVTGLTTITGVTINDAAGNAVGTGTLAYDNTNDTLRWTPPGGTAGDAIDVGTNGSYSIQGGNNGGLLKVTIVAASLPSSDLSNTLTIANQVNKLWDDVSKAESDAGDIEYRAIYVENAHGADSMLDVKIWIENNTPGQDVVAIALDTGGLNGTAEVEADESTAPSTADFDTANPVDEASALSLGTLATTDNYPIWIRRTVPAGTDAAEPNDTFRIAVKIKV